MSSPGAPVFTHAEDERLARVLLSLMGRADCDAARLGDWLGRFVALEKSVWARTPPDAAVLDASQNARNLLRSCYVLLTLPGTEATPGVLAAREKVAATLGEIQR